MATSIRSGIGLPALLRALKVNKFLTFEDLVLLDGFIAEAEKKADTFNIHSQILKRLKKYEATLPQAPFFVTEESIITFFAAIIEQEIAKGNPTPEIDSQIWLTLFKNTTLPGVDVKVSKLPFHLYSFLRCSLSHEQLLNEGEKCSIGATYTFLEALCIAREILQDGLYTQDQMGTAIYFSIGSVVFYIFIHRLRSNEVIEENMLHIVVRQYTVSTAGPRLHQVCFK